jgi:uncharacterized protein
MIQIACDKALYVAESTVIDAGRGVYAGNSIGEGELIERCPVIEVALNDPANNEQGLLVDYFFYFGKGLAIALGFGSIYNHSYSPNATYKVNLEQRTIDFWAIAEIAAGEEIMVNYNFGNPEDKSTPTVRGVPDMNKGG